MRKGHTDVTVVLDRSGSMKSIQEDMEGGFASFIARQRGLKGECRVTMVQFDSEATEIRYAGVPIGEVGALSLQPRGSTPLLDATAFAIRTTGDRLAALPESERPEQVLVMIITDGRENASSETSREELRRMIEHQRSAYKWDFIYLGANVDAFSEARQMGIPTTHGVDFEANSQGVDASWAVLGGKFGVYHGGDKKALEFTPEERDQMKRAGGPDASRRSRPSGNFRRNAMMTRNEINAIARECVAAGHPIEIVEITALSDKDAVVAARAKQHDQAAVVAVISQNDGPGQLRRAVRNAVRGTEAERVAS